MSDLKLVRTLTLKHPADDGTTRVEVHDLVGGDTDSRVPILLQFLDNTGQISATVELRWSEWDEVRDHVEYCATMMKPEPVAVNMSDPGLSAQTYRACGVKAPDSPPTSPGNQGGERCVLVYQHDLMVGGSAWHADRFGQTWPVL